MRFTKIAASFSQVNPDLIQTFLAEQFDQLYTFANNSGLRFIFDLNIMLRNDTNLTVESILKTRWNSTNAEKLLNYASGKGYDMDWELGNGRTTYALDEFVSLEPDGFPGIFYNLSLTGAQLAQDYKDLRVLLDANKLYRNSILIGPSGYGNNWVIPQ